jgi:hypothetical protein
MGILKSLAKMFVAMVAIFGPTPSNCKNLYTTAALLGFPLHILDAS